LEVVLLVGVNVDEFLDAVGVEYDVELLSDGL
jgi:hypothetical protein